MVLSGEGHEDTALERELREVSGDISAGFATLHDRIGAMSDIELFTIYHKSAQLGRQSWMLQAHILYEVSQRKAHHNDGGIRAAAREFGISPSNASGLIRAWESFGMELADRVTPDDHLVGVSWYKTLAYTEEPLTWLARTREAKRADPSYSIRDLREDIARDKVRLAPTPAAPLAPTLAHRPAPARALPDHATTSAPSTPHPFAASDDDLADRYRQLVAQLDDCTEGTETLVHRAHPADLAARLPQLDPTGLFEQEQLAVVFRFLLEVFQERAALAARGGKKVSALPRISAAG